MTVRRLDPPSTGAVLGAWLLGAATVLAIAGAVHGVVAIGQAAGSDGAPRLCIVVDGRAP